jgi:hypothetical protein
MTLTSTAILSIEVRWRCRRNSTPMRMSRRSRNDSTILLSKKLERNGLLCSLLTAILSSLPKSFVNPIALALCISTKAINFSLVPLPIVDISCFVNDPPSAVLLPVDKVTFVEMSLFYDLNAKTVLFYPAFLVKTHIAEVDISGVVKDDGFCDGRH